MKFYVAAPVAASGLVRVVQRELVAAGHQLTLDWTQDLSLVEGFAAQPDRSGRMATAMVDAVLAADAVVVLPTEHEGRGMFVELGVALAQAERGELEMVAVVGEVVRESVFYLHPRVRRYATVTAMLDGCRSVRDGEDDRRGAGWSHDPA